MRLDALENEAAHWRRQARVYRAGAASARFVHPGAAPAPSVFTDMATECDTIADELEAERDQLADHLARSNALPL